eukprot:CAMPEP_0206150424 /NCGR_PEP_ID=MMETSP1473-20131121/38293_1 /ASSEMBLY_ACC=CAM_ASM_001109 /TAXON_ID=1461547 /ORGANISM="Stichococcus sp, Strain RCC1054" /LENGTH=640 /DNA_ID=CAMNT_0053547925 /DNA_START=77 /DNA_END=1999 /DNA_ORIENTATION=+
MTDVRLAGCRDARYFLLVVGVVGDFLQGGLIFGWNSLALVLKQQGFFGPAGAHQEDRLTLVYTVGIFAANFSPVLAGPLLDWLGPRVLAVGGSVLTALGLLLIAISSPGGTDGLAGGTFCLGVGGVAFHMAQFNTSGAFPMARALVTGAYVSGFVGSALLFFLLRAVINGLGGSHAVYRNTLLVFMGVVALWAPLGAWVFPRRPLQLGQVFVFTRQWQFRAVTLRTFSQSQRGTDRRRTQRTSGNDAVALRLTDSKHRADSAQGFTGSERFSGDRESGEGLRVVGSSYGSSDAGGFSIDRGDIEARGILHNGDPPDVLMSVGLGTSQGPSRGMVGRGSAGCCEQETQQPPSQPSPLGHCAAITAGAGAPGQVSRGGRPGAEQSAAASGEGSSSEPLHHSMRSIATGGSGSDPPLKVDVVVPEAARFAALKSATLTQQMRSPVVLGLAAYFTASVFVLQLYLGMSRAQLGAKGDTGVWANMVSVVFACGGVFIPLTFYLTDRKGYGTTLGTVTALGVLTSAMQAVPNLGAQALTLAAWCGSRAILYSSYYAIVAALVGFRTFGTICGAISAVSGLVTLLILPISNAANAHLQPDRYWILNVTQVVALLPLFAFSAAMWRWERTDVVRSRFTGAADGRPAND